MVRVKFKFFFKFFTRKFQTRVRQPFGCSRKSPAMCNNLSGDPENLKHACNDFSGSPENLTHRATSFREFWNATPRLGFKKSSIDATSFLLALIKPRSMYSKFKNKRHHKSIKSCLTGRVSVLHQFQPREPEHADSGSPLH